MPEKQTHAVTGAYGYSGKYIARRLLRKRYRVITLTNSIHRSNHFGKKIRAYPFNFDNSHRLTQSPKGVEEEKDISRRKALLRKFGYKR